MRPDNFPKSLPLPTNIVSRKFIHERRLSNGIWYCKLYSYSQQPTLRLVGKHSIIIEPIQVMLYEGKKWITKDRVPNYSNRYKSSFCLNNKILDCIWFVRYTSWWYNWQRILKNNCQLKIQVILFLLYLTIQYAYLSFSKKSWYLLHYPFVHYHQSSLSISTIIIIGT